MQRNQHPFNGLEQGPDFDRARSMIATPFQYVDIALDVAGVNQIFNVSGDFLYVDASSTGVVTLELNNQYNDPSAPFQVSAGFGLQALFKQLKLTWTAQAGKRIRLMYSTGDKVVPTNSTTISGGVVVSQSGYVYASSYKSITALAANTPETVFTPAANVNGATLWRASFVSVNAAFPSAAFLAKNAAPATILDGDVIVAVDGIAATAAVQLAYGKLEAAIHIPAGKGLYYIASTAEVAASVMRSALYTLS